VKRALVLGVLILAVPAGASAQEPPPFNAQCGNLACRIERVAAKWQVLNVGRDSRTLTLVYESGGCRVGDGHAEVRETKSRIRIAVDEGEVVAIDTPDRQVVCTLEIRYRTLRVRLRRPVAGRRIVGDSPVAGGLSDGRVPRLIDLAFVDAREVLHAKGFEVRRFGQRHARVTFQSPRPGSPAPEREVGLTVGRHAFDARVLRSCLEKAGIPTTAARPRRGDEDAPDLELVLGRWRSGAVVALYADPARARENAPSIRRNLRGTEGVLERLGRVTIAWVRPPGATWREAVHSCVAGAKP
jgi:hypothetical protein